MIDLNNIARLIHAGWQPRMQEILTTCTMTQIGVELHDDSTDEEIANRLLTAMQGREYYGTKKLYAPPNLSSHYGYCEDVCIRLCSDGEYQRLDIGLFEKLAA